MDAFEGVAAVLMGWWSEPAAHWKQRPWSLLRTGLIDESTALAWCEAVWRGDETGE